MQRIRVNVYLKVMERVQLRECVQVDTSVATSVVRLVKAALQAAGELHRHALHHATHVLM